MRELVDTHCHLADPRLHADLESMLTRAAEAGVRTIIAVGAIGTIEADRLTVEIAHGHPDVFATVGVHPHEAGHADDTRMEELRRLATADEVVAIGETGLDFHYLHSSKEAQERSFRRHLELARELDLPVVVHCREAERRVVEIVTECGLPPAGGVIHCFTGKRADVGEFITLGFLVSFSGILTFRNADAVREAALAIPEDRLLVETDAPYLAPVPYRGKRNEPAYAARTLEELARIRIVDPGALAARTTRNAIDLFRLPR